jgi:hypothetical protein
MSGDSLTSVVRESLERLRERAAVLGGPADIAEAFADVGAHPDLQRDPDAANDLGFIAGVAAGLDVTVLELLDELGLA